MSRKDFNEAPSEIAEEIWRIFRFEKLEINPAGNALQLMIDDNIHRLSKLWARFSHFRHHHGERRAAAPRHRARCAAF